jgi:uncharacterized protein
VVLGVAATEVVAWRVLLTRAGRLPSLHPRGTAAALALLALALLEHGWFAYADLTSRVDVLKAAQLVPLYQPLTVKRLARRLGVDVVELPAVSQGKSSLVYPLAPIRASPPARRPNIIWVTLDSWRFDMLSAELTPNLTELASRGTLFRGHISGGNSTRHGVFSMFYGLHASYWKPVLYERRGPVLISRLRELGYRFAILSSTSLSWPEFRSTAFVDIADSVKDDFPGPTRDRDRAQVGELAARLDAAGDAPVFAWLLIDSSHAPYDFDEATARVRPYAENVSYGALRDLKGNAEARRLLKARYQNGVAYADGVVGDLVKLLQARSLLDKTIMVLTGDHGQEFFEHGYFGHNGAFTPEQTHVPLIIYDPERAPGVVDRRTSHADLVPTFMQLLGVDNPPSDYAAGESLFSEGSGDRGVISCGWDECARIDDNGFIVFSTESYGAGRVSVRDSDYREAADASAALANRRTELLAVMREMSRFLK